MARSPGLDSDEDSQLRFRPSARIQRFLGRELISDPNLAIVEFVKNAYDAGASQVLVAFRLDATTPCLVIADDGVGMNFESFRRNWMHPGYSEKSPEAHTIPKTAKGRRAAERQKKRRPIGEKGLGRLAAGRLGERMDVWTRPHTSEAWFHAHFEWSWFDDMEKSIDDVVIPHDNNPPPDDLNVSQFTSGTIVAIEDLSLRWEGRVPGRPMPGRRRTRLGRLKQDLTWLLRPLASADTDFRISLDSDIYLDDDVGDITIETARQQAEYRYEFDIRAEGDGATVRHTLHRTKGAAERGGSSVSESKEEHLGRDQLAERFRLSGMDDMSSAMSCGPIRGQFFYNPPEARQRARQKASQGHGVLLYRDNVLVEPYGIDGNDWLGVEARKAQRQGHALVQPNTFWGEVRIGRESNPELRDMANRQGLLENDASDSLIAQVQAEFRAFEELITPELENRWRTKSEVASARAGERLDFATTRTRLILHEVRQPLFALASELLVMGNLLSGQRPVEDLQEQLAEVHKNALAHLQRVEEALVRHGNLPRPDVEQVKASTLVKQSREQVSVLAAQSGVTVKITVASDVEVLVPANLVVLALTQLVRNALEAPRDGRPGLVMLTIDERKGDAVIRVEDNGTGMAGVQPGTPLNEIPLATKGRPAGGLALVVELLLHAQGAAVLTANSTDGVTVDVLLPTRVSGLRSRD